MGDVLSLASRQVAPDPTKTAATNEHRSERSEQLDTPVRERNFIQTAPRGPLACLAASRVLERRPCARRAPHTSWRSSGLPM